MRHNIEKATGKFFLMRDNEFQQKYGGLEKLAEYGVNIGGNLIIVCEGDAMIDGTLDLYYPAGWEAWRYESYCEFLSKFGLTAQPKDKAENIRGFAVTGNLTISGSLEDSSEMSAYLYVGGGLKANYVHNDNAFVVICGDSLVNTMLYAHYNGGNIVFERKLSVPVLLSTDYHCTTIGDPDVSLYAYDSDIDELDEDKEGNPKLPKELKAAIKSSVKSVEDINADMLDPKKATPEKMEKLRELMTDRRERERVQSFHRACKSDIELVKYYVASGIDINKEGIEAMISAAGSNCAGVVEYLAGLNVSVDVENSEGFTALLAACYDNSTDALKLLITKGADVNRENAKGITPLIAAAEKGHLEAINVLLKAKADPNLKTKSGMTMLARLVEENKVELYPIVLHSGANPADGGWDELFASVIKGDAEKVEKLLRAESRNLDEPDKQGHHLLSYAAIYNYDAIVKLLIAAEATVDIKNKRGSTPLYAAAVRGNLEALKVLEKAGAATDSPRPDGWTPLAAAASVNKMEVVSHLLEKKANPNAKASDSPAIYYAITHGNAEMTRLFIEAGADLKCKVRDNSMLYYAKLFLKGDPIVEVIKDMCSKKSKK